MVQMISKNLKDLGLQRQVMEALPYAVVGGAYEGSFTAAMYGDNYFVALNHIVPTGHQLKILFIRVCTQEEGGARFSIYQTNPSAAGATGAFGFRLMIMKFAPGFLETDPEGDKND